MEAGLLGAVLIKPFIKF